MIIGAPYTCKENFETITAHAVVC